MKQVIRWILILLCLAVFCFAGYKLVTTLLGYKQARDYYEETANEYVTPSGSLERNPSSGGDAELPETADAVETAPIEVDFDALRAQCSDVVGWLYCADTMINYPLVQGRDNSQYLHAMLDGSYSANGTVFMDYHCEPDFSSSCSILYGHNMRDGSMFHSLLEYGKQEYYDAHPVMYLLTPTKNYAVHIFAGFTTPADSWPYVIEFGSEEEKQAYLDKAIASSAFQAQTEPTVNDRILLLSTCSYNYDDARYLVLGILTPID